jgi:drug/metabolite transporter (DMT)-like permease
MVIAFALLAALSNAVNVLTQHIASTSDPGRSSGWRLVLYLFRSPLWLFGWVALAGAFVFQAVALHIGLVSVVQPLLATELVFALVLRRFWIRQSIRLITWGAAALTCAGLAVFVTAGEPTGGHATPASQHWIAAVVACAAGAGVLAAVAQRGSPSRRAAAYASAAAATWALVATFIKATTDTLTQFGVAGMFTRWPVYALAAGGAAGTLLQQAALHAGPLRVSQPFLVLIDPVVSIALSVWLFGEHFTSDAAVLAIAAIGFAVMCAGVVLLTHTTPATMQASPAPAHQTAG